MAVPAGGLTYLDIQTEMQGQRFGASLATSIRHWIHMREGVVWSWAEWPFKSVRREAVVATTDTLTPPATFWKAVTLEDSNGDELQYLEPDDFNDAYQVGDDSTGPPENYTVLNGLILLGPAPSGSTTLYLSYERRLSHYNTSDAIVAGPMAADTDYPIYPPEYHYMLVMGATASGLKVQNDPTWDALEQEFISMLGTMTEDLLPADLYGTVQYGRDRLW